LLSFKSKRYLLDYFLRNLVKKWVEARMLQRRLHSSVLLISYCLMGVLYYLRLRIEILKWMIENEWNGRVVNFIRTLFFGWVNVQ